MQKSPEDLKIFAYLSSHPLDDHFCADGDYLKWIPGFVNEPDEEEGIDAIHLDCNIIIYDQILEITENHFTNSVKNMWPLLADTHINSMQIAIDLLGIIGSGKNSLAGYLYDLSDQLKGNYVFQLDLNLLATYLIKNDNNEPLDFHDKSVWDHEFIHLLDHKYITAASLYKSSTSPFENFKYFLIKYREEGIADLYYVLHGHTKVTNIQEAIENFKATAINRKSEIDFTIPSTDKTRDKLYEGIDFYKYGPWLILEILRDYETNFEQDMIANSIEKISNKEEVPIETIFNIIKKALEIQPKEFLYYYEKYFEEGFIPLI